MRENDSRHQFTLAKVHERRNFSQFSVDENVNSKRNNKPD